MEELSGRKPAATQTFSDICCDQGEFYFLHFLSIYITFILS